MMPTTGHDRADIRCVDRSKSSGRCAERGKRRGLDDGSSGGGGAGGRGEKSAAAAGCGVVRVIHERARAEREFALRRIHCVRATPRTGEGYSRVRRVRRVRRVARDTATRESRGGVGPLSVKIDEGVMVVFR